jgi:hypothetical protein
MNFLSFFFYLVLGVSQLQAQQGIGGGVELSWTASVTPVVTYEVYRGVASGKENYAAPLNATPISTLRYRDATAAMRSTYFYTVEAVKGTTHSVPSNEVSVRVF